MCHLEPQVLVLIDHIEGCARSALTTRIKSFVRVAFSDAELSE